MAEATAVDRVRPECAEAIHPESPKGARIPYPPPELTYCAGAPTLDNFLLVGERWNELIGRYVAPACRIVDVGCGCGRTARFLVENPDIEEYVGFDVVPENVGWCRRFVTAATDGRFRFEHLDVRSSVYHPRGTVKPSEARFPVEDGWADVVFAAAVFTHLLEPDALHYLAEIARVLKRGGLAIASIHKETPPSILFQGSEFRIDVYPAYFEGLAARHSLVVHERVGDVCGQETYAFRCVRPPAR